MAARIKRSFARYDMQDMKHVVEPKPSIFWQALSVIGWGIAFGILAGFVIVALHLGR